MATLTVALESASHATMHLHNPVERRSYTGSGTPWTSSGNTPYQIGMNDATGERFVLAAPPVTPITSGQPPFALWGRTVGLQYTTRQITIPVQMYANTQARLGKLLTELRRRLNSAVTVQPLYLVVTYDGEITTMRVEGGSVQENARFWADEDGRGVLRATLTLTCTPGTGSSATLLSSVSLTNANATVTTFDSLDGDWTHTLGNPMTVTISGGDIADPTAKVLYAAVIAGSADSGALSSAISTTSTSGVAVTGSVTLPWSDQRGTRARFFAQVTTPNAALQLRVVVRLRTSSGAVLYTGPWLSPGTSTTIVDLGFIVPPQDLMSYTASSLFASIEARSSTGGSATGTLARLRAIEYYTFARVTVTTGSGEVLTLVAPRPGFASGGTVGGVDAPLAFTTSSGQVAQRAIVAGAHPRAFEDASLWLAWTSAGVFDPADSVTVSAVAYPVYETIAEP